MRYVPSQHAQFDFHLLPVEHFSGKENAFSDEI
jgi:hypothetical protein